MKIEIVYGVKFPHLNIYPESASEAVVLKVMAENNKLYFSASNYGSLNDYPCCRMLSVIDVNEGADEVTPEPKAKE
jgi:hypothetical protein